MFQFPRDTAPGNMNLKSYTTMSVETIFHLWPMCRVPRVLKRGGYLEILISKWLLVKGVVAV